MKKIIIAGLILVLCTTVYAANVELTITIPTQYLSRAVAALRACENTHVRIHFQGSQNAEDPNVPDFVLDVDYRIDEIEGETHADYGKRFIRTMLYNVIKAYETKTATEDRQALIDAVPPVDVNVPDGIIE